MLPHQSGFKKTMLIVSYQIMYSVKKHFYINLNNYIDHLSTYCIPGIILITGNTVVYETVLLIGIVEKDSKHTNKKIVKEILRVMLSLGGGN